MGVGVHSLPPTEQSLSSLCGVVGVDFDRGGGVPCGAVGLPAAGGGCEREHAYGNFAN